VVRGNIISSLLLNETGNRGHLNLRSLNPAIALPCQFNIKLNFDIKISKSIKHYNNKYEKQGNKPERRLWKKEPLRHGEEDGQYSWAII
jgi:hypothetical protein